MFIAMNRFKVLPGAEADFEAVWLNRESNLHAVPGFVEFANQLQDKGRGKFEAVIEAAGLRLRPILMTTGAMVLGALPLALAAGAGAESRQQIGWVIVGGISFGTVFTLFVVPVFYSLIAEEHRPETVEDDGESFEGPVMDARPFAGIA